MTHAVLDTSAVIDLPTDPEWSAVTPLISTVTLAELHAGIEAGDAVERATRRRRLNYIEATFQVLPFAKAEAEAYGLLVILIREGGRRHRGRIADLQIAATAVVAGVPLLTRNGADFAGLERVVRVVGLQ